MEGPSVSQRDGHTKCPISRDLSNRVRVLLTLRDLPIQAQLQCPHRDHPTSQQTRHLEKVFTKKDKTESWVRGRVMHKRTQLLTELEVAGHGREPFHQTQFGDSQQSIGSTVVVRVYFVSPSAAEKQSLNVSMVPFRTSSSLSTSVTMNPSDTGKPRPVIARWRTSKLSSFGAQDADWRREGIWNVGEECDTMKENDANDNTAYDPANKRAIGDAARAMTSPTFDRRLSPLDLSQDEIAAQFNNELSSLLIDSNSLGASQSSAHLHSSGHISGSEIVQDIDTPHFDEYCTKLTKQMDLLLNTPRNITIASDILKHDSNEAADRHLDTILISGALEQTTHQHKQAFNLQKLNAMNPLQSHSVHSPRDKPKKVLNREQKRIEKFREQVKINEQMQLRAARKLAGKLLPQFEQPEEVPIPALRAATRDNIREMTSNEVLESITNDLLDVPIEPPLIRSPPPSTTRTPRGTSRQQTTPRNNTLKSTSRTLHTQRSQSSAEERHRPSSLMPSPLSTARSPTAVSPLNTFRAQTSLSNRQTSRSPSLLLSPLSPPQPSPNQTQFPLSSTIPPPPKRHVVPPLFPLTPGFLDTHLAHIGDVVSTNKQMMTQREATLRERFYPPSSPRWIRFHERPARTARMPTYTERTQLVKWMIVVRSVSFVAVLSDGLFEHRAKHRVADQIEDVRAEMEEEQAEQERVQKMEEVLTAADVIMRTLGQLAMHFHHSQREENSRIIRKTCVYSRAQLRLRIRVLQFRRLIMKGQKIAKHFTVSNRNRLLVLLEMWDQEEEQLIRSRDTSTNQQSKRPNRRLHNPKKFQPARSPSMFDVVVQETLRNDRILNQTIPALQAEILWNNQLDPKYLAMINATQPAVDVSQRGKQKETKTAKKTVSPLGDLHPISDIFQFVSASFNAVEQNRQRKADGQDEEDDDLDDSDIPAVFDQNAKNAASIVDAFINATSPKMAKTATLHKSKTLRAARMQSQLKMTQASLQKSPSALSRVDSHSHLVQFLMPTVLSDQKTQTTSSAASSSSVSAERTSRVPLFIRNELLTTRLIVFRHTLVRLQLEKKVNHAFFPMFQYFKHAMRGIVLNGMQLTIEHHANNDDK
ncbi:hypothetical protein BLNAU_21501 [Blattamonas nauphoetae]|uniref:Uncharacterized protein n=1 Tax=Blattamonas nauphoetae TaxID=2049346 RepID=A0ABQ9WZW4_9EUKA|nr:hypothetical protein BLNAU_21501 [Blattamonas nauphoetae]